jgi:hypothetical protein
MTRTRAQDTYNRRYANKESTVKTRKGTCDINGNPDYRCDDEEKTLELGRRLGINA